MLSDGNKNAVLFVVLVLIVFFVVIGVRGCVAPRHGDAVPLAQKPKVRTPQAGPFRGRIAIVIDDWGYNRKHCQDIAAIRAPLGIAIIPGLPYSQDVVRCAASAGKEPMLHLPMEPHRYPSYATRKEVLTTDMSADEVRRLLGRFLAGMDGVVGVNNHMGSKGTEDPDLVGVVLAEMKKRGLFFIDSVTSERSVCQVVADRLGVLISSRDVFLDNQNNRAAIEKQFAEAVRVAQRKGHALVIGHDRSLTLAIIREQVDKLKAEGFDFISVKEYIDLYAHSRH